MKKNFAVLVVFFTVIFSSCIQKKIDLNFQDESFIAPDQEWLVVTVPYAAFRVFADFSSEICFHARSGDIFLICGKQKVQVINAEEKKSSKDYLVWYKVEQGWIDGSLVAVYDTKLKAETAAKRAYEKN
ncbi:hypothetical protein [uncultured Treponema sp.]|uniref:hypothetical protein n=1 Tax=uncultured Treponema sp. TaxID=162155 RepID=UPI0025D5294A|nr:hypothetical protein [uncultured Treponema sp.]